MANIEKKIILNLFKKRQIPHLSQFRYIFRFLTKKERNTLLVFLGLTLISFIGLFTLIYLHSTKITPTQGGEYIEGVVGYTRFINPLYSQSNEVDRDLVSLIYSGLTKRNTRGNIVLDLAEKYTLSDDEKTYTFELKENVLWHDGKKMAADDIIFTINAIQEKNYNSPLRSSWEKVEAQKIDDYTVQFKLQKPYGNFLTLLTVGILPKHIWEKVPVANINLAEANNKPIGSGPYRFESFVKDKVGAIKSYQLEISKDYYEKKPNIKRIILKFYPDYASATQALDSHQIDGLAFIPAEARMQLKLKGRLEQYDVGLPQYNTLFLNEKQNAILKSKALRKALVLAIDRNKIIREALDGDGIIIEGPILPGYPGFDEKISRNFYDKEAALRALIEEGWVLKDGNRYRTKGSQQLKITLTTIEKGQNVKAAGIIKDNWAEIGVEVELKIVSTANIYEDVINKRSYEVLLFGAMYGSDLDPYQYWHSSQAQYPGLNLAMYSNRKADVLLEDARQTLDKIVRQEKYKEFQELLIEDFPAIFLWQPRYTYMIDKKIKGIQISEIITPSDRFQYIMEGYVKMKRTLR
ncbi:hypothetical protein KJ885_05055 [Patescibacteria group bacterium]|nr:hypothetical protein [Patescibacteria group bacterium]